MSDQLYKEDAVYRNILIEPLMTCADYLPKMGSKSGVNLDAFKRRYSEDPLYHWMGFDDPLMYSAHRAAGGMTSLYRQLGIGVERLFRRILMDSFGLTEEEAKWDYEYTRPNGSPGTRSLDARLDLKMIESSRKRSVDYVKDWVAEVRRRLKIEIALNGAVFEVREGYKSADSKRQNADLDNLSHALKRGYLMTMALMSLQMNETVRKRYQEGGLLVLVGDIDSDDPCESTYAFFDHVVGYDLAAFFERNSKAMQRATASILEKLLGERS